MTRKALIRQIDGLVMNVVEHEDPTPLSAAVQARLPGGEGLTAQEIEELALFVRSCWPCPEGCILIPSEIASPGDTWDGTEFHRPPALPSPAPTRQEILLAKMLAGEVLTSEETVEALQLALER